MSEDALEADAGGDTVRLRPVPRPADPTSAKRLRRRVVGFAALAAGLGAASGVVWWLVVRLPSYSVAANGRAGVGERGLTEFFGGDAWFCLIGIVVGLVLGILGWRLFRLQGWPVAVAVVVLSSVAALLCWAVGYALGPGSFVPRLAAAQPGASVPIELTVRSGVAVLVWPLAAIVPVLLASSLGRDDETPVPRSVRASRPVTSAGATRR